MQDAVNTTPGVDSQPFQVTLPRSGFTPEMLSDSEHSEPSQEEILTYMRGVDPIRPIITSTGGEMNATMAEQWATEYLARMQNRVQVTTPAESNNTPQGPEIHPRPEPGVRYRARDERGWVVDEIGTMPTILSQLRPLQEEYNLRQAEIDTARREAVARMWDETLEAERRPHLRIHPRITEEDEVQLDMLASRLENFERQNASQQVENKKKKTMEAVKERKSIYKHRFSDAPWFEWLKGREIVVLGAGGIGSWVVFALARIGCQIYVYDMDTIEPHNLGGQMYGRGQVGANKAQAIAQLANEFAGGEALIEYFGEFNDDCPVGPIVISCFDNMAGRALAFEKWSQALADDPENAADYLFIDGRLLAEDYQVYGVIAGRLDDYKKTLFSDSEVGEAACSLKATTHCSMGICSDIVGVLSNFAANRAHGIDARDVPFSIIKSIPFFTYELNYGVDEQPQESTAERDPQPAL